MRGKVIGITEGSFGGDIITIKSNTGVVTIESRGFVNGRNGLILDTADSIEFDVVVNPYNGQSYAKNIRRYT